MRLVWATFLLLSPLSKAFSQPKCASESLMDSILKDYPSKLEYHISKGKLLPTLMLPRVSGTKSHARVKSFIVKELKKLNWTLELDTFSARTPIGKKEFTNIVATQNIYSRKKIVLACHYDSKYFPPPNSNLFQGATDAAGSCAMVLSLAKKINDITNQMGIVTDQISIQVIFFDGEEAFKDWTDADSLYGSRHLASKWKSTRPPSAIRRNELLLSKSRVQEIGLFILLDLLGADNPPTQLHNFFTETANEFNLITGIEQRLRPKLLTYTNIEYFLPYERDELLQTQKDARIDDDHRPFLELGVRCLHMIPVPFPSVWHTLEDDADALDTEILKDLSKILLVFLTELLIFQ